MLFVQRCHTEGENITVNAKGPSAVILYKDLEEPMIETQQH